MKVVIVAVVNVRRSDWNYTETKEAIRRAAGPIVDFSMTDLASEHLEEYFKDIVMESLLEKADESEGGE